MYMYIVYNTHTSTHHTHIHTLSQETKSIKGVMIFILKKKKKIKCFCCYLCLENMRNELRLRDKLTERRLRQAQFIKILYRQKFFGAKVSPERKGEREREKESCELLTSAEQLKKTSTINEIFC